MSSGYRQQRLTIRRLIFIALALALASIGLVSAWSVQLGYEREAHHRSENHKNYTYDVIIKRCSRSAVESQSRCVDDAIDSTRANEREEYDLYAQKTSALWTSVAGASAFVGVALSSVGVWLVYTTFLETRRQSTAFIKFEESLLYAKPWGLPTFQRRGGKWHAKFQIEICNAGRSPALMDYILFEQGSRKVDYQCIVDSGKCVKLDHIVDIEIPGVEYTLVCIGHVNVVQGNAKRVMLIAFNKNTDGKYISVSCHPKYIMYQGDEGYEDTFD